MDQITIIALSNTDQVLLISYAVIGIVILGGGMGIVTYKLSKNARITSSNAKAILGDTKKPHQKRSSEYYLFITGAALIAAIIIGAIAWMVL